MLTLTLDLTTGDDCDQATLMGLVRDALRASPALRDALAFRGTDTVSITSPMRDRDRPFSDVFGISDPV